MKRLLVVSPLLVLLSCNGQQEPSAEKSSADKIVEYYNGKQIDSIFNMFSHDMKEALPLNKAKAFFTQLYKDAGSIEKHTLISTTAGTSRYRTEFQNSVLWLDISQNRYGKLDGLRFTPYDGPEEKAPVIRNQTKMSLPFSGEWFVFWGGDTKEQNYHVSTKAQRHAFDIVIKDSAGKSYRTNGETNDDYYAFGQPLTAPCDAEVVAVIEGVKDNIPGVMNPEQLTGNSVVLKTGNNEYLLLAHFKLNSIKVKTGESVKKGQLLGLCGNSGNSSEPHLHFHIQNQEKMAGATGIKCFFEKLLVNGTEKKDYSPVRGERIKNAN
ncbi:MAG: peptidoglycan DD-metalloendopeptidase family protein [Bacteroidota bacterium]